MTLRDVLIKVLRSYFNYDKNIILSSNENLAK